MTAWRAEAMDQPKRAALTALVAVTTGCGIQAAGGAAMPSVDFPEERSTYAGVGLQTQSVRQNGSVIGVRTTIRRHEDALQVRNAILGLGWDWHVGDTCPFGFEAMLEMGAGGSAVPQFPGVGMYTGVALPPRLRLFGSYDRRPGYALVMANVDLVLVPRFGIWLPPAGAANERPYVEGAIELALRVSLASDLVNAKPQSTVEEPPREKPEP